MQEPSRNESPEGPGPPEDRPRPDALSWDEFVRRHALRVQRAARRVSRDEDEAADLAADVLANFRSNWPKLIDRFAPEGGKRFDAWLSVVARNAAIDSLRGRHGRGARHVPTIPLDAVAEPADSTSPEDAHQGERARTVWSEILRTLSGDERVLLRLYFLEGRDAESLRRLFGGRTRSQIYNRVHTLTKKLEALAERSGLEAEDVAHLATLDLSKALREEES